MRGNCQSKFQQENNTLRELKALSFDFWFAKAEEYYWQRYQEMMEEAWKYEMFPKWEIDILEEEEEDRPQSDKIEDAKTWDYLVPERELNHIKKHIYRTQKARHLRPDQCQTPPGKVPREMPSPKTRPLQKNEHIENAQRTPKARTPRQQVAWAQEQMKRHHDRMARARELAESSSKDSAARSLASPAPPLPKPRARTEEEREFEWVTAYPLAQPHKDAPIEVTILREKARGKNEKSTSKRALEYTTVFEKSTRK